MKILWTVFDCVQIPKVNLLVFRSCIQAVSIRSVFHVIIIFADLYTNGAWLFLRCVQCQGSIRYEKNPCQHAVRTIRSPAC